MNEQAIHVTDDQIYIAGHLFVHKDFSITNTELILDAFSKHYISQTVLIYFHDGENLRFTNLIKFVEYLCNCFSIPYDRVTIESHCDDVAPFKHIPMVPGIFVSVNQHLPQITHNVTDSKFVGTLLGRFNPTRFRLAYEIDKMFPGDNFTVFQPHIEQVKQHYRHLSNLYIDELSWLSTKQFDKDLASNHYSGMIDWTTSCKQYGNVCNNYQIEIISETDATSDFWFTEKTARCLATGKPFVLIAGKGSLKKLRSMGFKTFDPIINELYDHAVTPTWRIQGLLFSLKELYTNPDRDNMIKQLYDIAALNIEIYKEHVRPK